MKKHSSARTLLGLLALLCAWACACAPQRASDLPYRSGTIERRADGSVEWARLARAARFDGVPCAEWVRFHANGRLHSCVLAEDWRFGSRELPRQTTVFLDAEGVLTGCWLRHERVLDGLPVEGGPWKSHTSFHPNGRLHFVFLSKEAEIQGVPCADTSFHPVELDAEGRLLGCQLARDFERDGQLYRKGARLRLDAQGAVAEAR